MAVLHVNLFGCPQFSDNDRGVEIKLTHTIQALLAYLLVERKRTHSREVLASLFWSDNSQNRAHASLNTALWRLRCAIEAHSPPDSPFLILDQKGEICFNRNSSYWLDVEAFEDLTSRLPGSPQPTISPASVQTVEQAVQLYRGSLLEGFYEDWVLRERERLRTRYLACLAYLMFAYQKLGNAQMSLLYGQKVLSEEPLSEETHRAVMRLYDQMGQRALALRQYETCRDILNRELGIAPMPETAELARQIRSQISSQVVPVTAQAGPLLQLHEAAPSTFPSEETDTLRHTLQELHSALSYSDAVRQQIQQAIQTIETILKSR